MDFPDVIDLHMHTTVSDGTDTPEEIIAKVEKAGIGLFSVTDHDAVSGSAQILELLMSRPSPKFITGVEFSCKDEKGKYHILGYAYDPAAEPILSTVETAHALRIKKTKERLEFLQTTFGIVFDQADVEALFRNPNPGKPHIARLMMQYGYASSIKDAMDNYLNKKKFGSAYTLPEDAITAILKSGGVPVLAHPIFGDGDQLILGEEMDERLRYLIDFGLEGVEAYYSGFSHKLIGQMLSFAEKYDLYITAGSDYHGKNKLVKLADTNLENAAEAAPGFMRFWERVK